MQHIPNVVEKVVKLRVQSLLEPIDVKGLTLTLTLHNGMPRYCLAMFLIFWSNHKSSSDFVVESFDGAPSNTVRAKTNHQQSACGQILIIDVRVC